MIYPPKPLIPCVDAYSSLIFSNDRAMEKAVTESFIRCFANDENWIDYENSYNYSRYGVFRGFELTSDFIKNNFENIHLVIDNCLKNDYKVLYNIDTYYVRDYITYHEQHLIHPIFIFDRKEEEGLYVCRDYFDFMLYSEKLIHSDDLDKAFIESYITKEYYYNCVIMGFKLEENNRNNFDGLVDNKRINVTKIISLLKEFLDGSNFIQYEYDSYLRNVVHLYKGIHVFDSAKLELETYINNPDVNFACKKLKFLEHHIFMMKERLNVLEKIYKFDKDMTLLKLNEKILRDMETLTFSAIKFSITKNISEMNKLICLLESIKLTYRGLISDLIDKLEHIRKNQ